MVVVVIVAVSAEDDKLLLSPLLTCTKSLTWLKCKEKQFTPKRGLAAKTENLRHLEQALFFTYKDSSDSFTTKPSY